MVGGCTNTYQFGTILFIRQMSASLRITGAEVFSLRQFRFRMCRNGTNPSVTHKVNLSTLMTIRYLHNPGPYIHIRENCGIKNCPPVIEKKRRVFMCRTRCEEENQFVKEMGYLPHMDCVKCSTNCDFYDIWTVSSVHRIVTQYTLM